MTPLSVVAGVAVFVVLCLLVAFGAAGVFPGRKSK